MGNKELDAGLLGAKYGFIAMSLILAGFVMYETWTTDNVAAGIFVPFITGQLIFWGTKYMKESH
jgi:hypothetical protein